SQPLERSILPDQFLEVLMPKLSLILILLCPILSSAELGGAPHVAPSGPSRCRTQMSTLAVTFNEYAQDTQTVREYVGPDGKVYAVTWAGPKRPDLSTLIGTYFPEYSKAITTTTHKQLRRGLSAESGNLEIHEFG